MLRAPNLFVVGAPKCGTTTLYDYLVLHPEVLMSKNKEPAFFDKGRLFDLDGNANDQAWKVYLTLFDDGSEMASRYLGDATPTMVFPRMARRIHRMCGSDVKVIISLRNPVDRAYSHYWHGYRLGLESGNPDMEIFQTEEPDDVCDTGRFPKHYLLTGRYWLHIERFVNEFGRQNVLLLDFDELVADAGYCMTKVWSFLGIEPVRVQGHHSNPAQAPIFPSIQRFIAEESQLKALLKKLVTPTIRQQVGSVLAEKNLRKFRYPPMSTDLRKRLENYYRKDNFELSERFGVDITGWVKR